MNRKRLLARLLEGSVSNVLFTDMVSPAKGFGFRLVRTSGSHHIFAHDGIPEFINLQNAHGQAKPYQIRQLMRLVEKHNLTLEDEK